jgi:hypothetical protein
MQPASSGANLLTLLFPLSTKRAVTTRFIDQSSKYATVALACGKDWRLRPPTIYASLILAKGSTCESFYPRQAETMHLTITDGETEGLPAFTANVVDAGAPAYEIETTFEMIEAGENVLLEELGGVVSSYWSAPDLAK